MKVLNAFIFWMGMLFLLLAIEVLRNEQPLHDAAISQFYWASIAVFLMMAVAMLLDAFVKVISAVHPKK
jgi:hypothetical protein